MGFDAANAVEPLDYDFTAFGGSKGTIPEPTQDDLRALMDELRRVGAEIGLSSIADAASPEAVQKALATADESIIEEGIGRMVGALAGICHGTPSEDEINALPVRVRQAFVDWLLSEVTDPTSLHAGTRPSPVLANGASPAT